MKASETLGEIAGDLMCGVFKCCVRLNRLSR